MYWINALVRLTPCTSQNVFVHFSLYCRDVNLMACYPLHLIRRVAELTARFISSRSNLFIGKSVLELGCGLGLCGIVAGM